MEMFSTNNRIIMFYWRLLLLLLLLSPSFPPGHRQENSNWNVHNETFNQRLTHGLKNRNICHEWWPFFVLSDKFLPTFSHYLIFSHCISLYLPLLSNFLSLFPSPSLSITLRGVSANSPLYGAEHLTHDTPMKYTHAVPSLLSCALYPS